MRRTHLNSLRADLREPQPGEKITLLGADHQPGAVTCVRQVLASDFTLEIFEVRDDRGQFIYVEPADHPRNWIEVDPEDYNL